MTTPGTYQVEICRIHDVAERAFELRLAGWEMRDCICIETPEGPLLALLIRHAMAQTVHENIVRHGVGAIDIENTRITTGDNLDGGAYSQNASERHDGDANWRFKRGEFGNAGEYEPPSGRFPSNFILQHTEECEMVGERKVKSGTAGPNSGRIGEHGIYGEIKEFKPNPGTSSYASADGTETIPDWRCSLECPVAALDGLSGILYSGGGVRNSSKAGGVYGDYHGTEDERTMPASSGGASRFFFNATCEEDYLSYLNTLVRG